MEYIQCPQCHKKYGVNEKVRAASGKTIRCKNCQQPFEITIFSTPSAEKRPATQAAAAKGVQKSPAETEATAQVEQKAAAKPVAQKKRNLLPLIFTALLGVSLLVGLAVAYRMLSVPAPVEPEKTVAEKTAPEKPVSREPAEPAKEPETAATAEEAKGEEAKGEEAKGEEEAGSGAKATDEPLNATSECKQAATDQWYTDYMLTNGSMTGREYVRLLDESSAQTEQVRTLCQSKYLASKITEAAKLGIKPEWIAAEIEARATPSQTSGADRRDKW